MPLNAKNTHARNEQKVADARKQFEADNSLKNLKALALALRNCALGDWWGQKGKFDLEKMARASLEAAQYYAVLNDHFEAAKAYNFASIPLGYLGKSKDSIKVIEQAKKEIALAKKLKQGESSELSRELIKNTFYHSTNIAVLGNIKSAIKLCQIGLRHIQSEPSKPSTDKNWLTRYKALFERGLGINFLHLGKFKKSLEHLSHALELFRSINDPTGEAKTLKEIGHVYLRTNQPEQAMKVLKEAITLHTKIKSSDSWNHFHLANALELLGKTSDATDEFERAMELVETERAELEEEDNRISFFAQKLLIYDGAIEHFQKLGKVDKAYQVVQRSKARVFLELLLQKHSEEGSEKQFIQRDVASLEQIQSSLAGDDAVIDYYLGKEKSWIYLVTKNGIVARDLPVSVFQISVEVKSFYGFLKQVAADHTHHLLDWHLKRLYDILIAPITQEIVSAKKLIFVPNRDLFLLPFGALKTPDDHYLIETKTISYLPTASMIGFPFPKGVPARAGYLTEDASEINYSFLAFANPTGDLYHSEKEVEEVSKLFSKKQNLFR